jgi:protein associated with RNAse G/E
VHSRELGNATARCFTFVCESKSAQFVRDFGILFAMPKTMSLYLDDSGTRNPDQRVPEAFMYKDWFTLGGYIANEEEEGIIRTAHANFCERWKIDYPLHSYDIRSKTENFTWLSALDDHEYNRFMRELSEMLLTIPVIGFACVVDRPGYNKRYRKKYGRQTWMLCRTAFAVVVERAAKYATKSKCRLRVYVEEGDKTADAMIREYYRSLRSDGMPFAAESSAKYASLSATELAYTLYDLDFKAKSSPLAQIADLYAYPIARGGYDPEYRPYTQLWERNKLIDCLLSEEEISYLGMKYSCFELVEAEKRKQKNKKSRV